MPYKKSPMNMDHKSPMKKKSPYMMYGKNLTIW